MSASPSRPAQSIGISSYTYRWAMDAGQLDAWQLVDRAARMRLQTLQFLDNVPLDRWADDDLRELGRRAIESGLSLQIGTSGLDPARLRRYVEVARLCGASLIRATVDRDLEDAYRALRSMLPDLEANGSIIALENHFSHSSDQLLALVRRLSTPQVAICLDTLNSIARLEGPAETVAKLAPYAVCVHLKDGTTVREGTSFRIAGSPLGEGLLDLPSLLRIIRASGKLPPLLVELWQNRGPDLAATLAAEEAWVGRSLSYARRLADVASS